MAIFSPLKLSNLVWYVHNMMGNFIQESCDQSRGGSYQNDHSWSQGGGGGPGKVQNGSCDIWMAPNTYFLHHELIRATYFYNVFALVSIKVNSLFCLSDIKVAVV